MKLIPNIKINRVSDEKGMALVAALLFVVLMALLAQIAAQWAARDIERTYKYTRSRTAFYVAEAGIAKAINYMNYDASGDSPGEAGDGFDDDLAAGLSMDDVSYQGHEFTVTITDNNDGDSNATDDADNAVIFTSVGTANTWDVSVEALIYRPLYTADHAIVTDGDLEGAGATFIVDGTAGSIHANEDANFTSTPTVTGGATASGTCVGAPCTNSGVLEEDIPIIDIPSLKPYAHYVLKSDGTFVVRTFSTPPTITSTTTYVYTSAGGGNWTTSVLGDGNALIGDISYNSGGGKWTLNGTTAMPDGFYYSETDIIVSSTPDPFTISIASEGYITITANGVIQNCDSTHAPCTNHPVEIGNIFLVAATDLKFAGNPTQTIQGLMYCDHQFDIGGTATLNGNVFSHNDATTEVLVNSTFSKIHGNFHLTYNGDISSPFFGNKVKILAWQEDPS